MQIMGMPTEKDLKQFEERFARSLDEKSISEIADDSVRALMHVLDVAKQLARENAKLRNVAL